MHSKKHSVCYFEYLRDSAVYPEPRNTSINLLKYLPGLKSTGSPEIQYPCAQLDDETSSRFLEPIGNPPLFCHEIFFKNPNYSHLKKSHFSNDTMTEFSICFHICIKFITFFFLLPNLVNTVNST